MNNKSVLYYVINLDSNIYENSELLSIVLKTLIFW